jgi:molybdopterin-containing oxidoreductase family membrane subunit
MGLVIPGFIPSPLGEMVEYSPTLNETLVCFGIWAFGLLCYTILLRMAVPILQGRISRANEARPARTTVEQFSKRLCQPSSPVTISSNR